MANPIEWRTFKIPRNRLTPAVYYKYESPDDSMVVITVLDLGDMWRAEITVGDLQAQGAGIDAHSALETALVALKAELTRHEALIQETFP